MKSTQKAGAAGAGAILICLSFTPMWEGLWTTAKVDTIGTGHPVTYCYGQTDELGHVKAGEKFTPVQCKAILKKSLEKYAGEIAPCIKVAISDKTRASLIDAALNAGSWRICRSPMVAKINAGDVFGGCDAFIGWIIRSDGVVRKGLIARRSGVSGDKRENERQLCLEGAKQKPASNPSIFTRLINFLFKRS